MAIAALKQIELVMPMPYAHTAHGDAGKIAWISKRGQQKGTDLFNRQPPTKSRQVGPTMKMSLISDFGQANPDFVRYRWHFTQQKYELTMKLQAKKTRLTAGLFQLR